MAKFDSAATVYDRDWTKTAIGRRQRERVWKYLDTFDRNLTVLELACGTGEDAQHLSSLGYRVTATDVSKKMLQAARLKCTGSNVEFLHWDMTNRTLELEGRRFDLVFTNFGGLNCLTREQLSNVQSNLIKMLSPGGHFVAVVMPKDTLLDRWYRQWKGEGFARSHSKPTTVNVEAESVPTYYYNPEDLQHAFSKFELLATRPIGFLPSFFSRWSKYWIINGIFMITDRILMIFANPRQADHYLIHLRRQRGHGST